MANWLFKQEPSCYSYADLEKEGTTVWDGVTNALALKHLRTCQPGDKVFYYHTGDDKAIVGIAEITGPPVPDPKLDDPKLVVVPVSPVKPLAKPVTLAQLKADGSFAEWELIRISRLSVMPCTQEIWDKIMTLAGESSTPVKKKKK